MCASVALALLHVGFMPMQAFAESGAVNDDWEQTGKVTVIYHRQGTHRKPGINHHRGHKHGTPGHRGSHHKHRHSHADPHRDHASPRSPEPSKSQPAPGFSDAPVRTITWYQYLPGLNSHDRKSKPARRAPRPAPTKPAGPTPEQISAWSVDIATSIRLAKPVVDVQPRPSANGGRAAIVVPQPGGWASHREWICTWNRRITRRTASGYRLRNRREDHPLHPLDPSSRKRRSARPISTLRLHLPASGQLHPSHD